MPRNYSSVAGEMLLQSAISSSNTTITVDTTAGLPGSYPYTLILDYGAAAEEIVDVTAAAGTALTVVRGRDGTVAQSHGFGAKIRHGMTARDLRESRDHEDAVTGVHGITGSVVGTSDAQTLHRKTFQPTDDTAPLTVRHRNGNASPMADFRSDVDNRWGSFTFAGLNTFNSDGTSLASLLWGGQANLLKQMLTLNMRSTFAGVVANVTAGASGKFLRLLNGATELFSVDITGKVKAAGVESTAPVSVTGDVTASGNVTASTVTANTSVLTQTLTAYTGVVSPTITALQSADSALGTRVTTLESTVVHAATGSIPLGGGGTQLSATVNLPSGKFSSTPFVVAVANAPAYVVSVQDNNNTSTFTITGRRADGGAITGNIAFTWIAVKL